MPENQSNPLSDPQNHGTEAVKRSDEEHVWDAQVQSCLPEPAMVRSRVPGARTRIKPPGMRTRAPQSAHRAVLPPWPVLIRTASAGSMGRMWLVRFFNFITVASMALIFGATIKLLWLWLTGQWMVTP